MTANDVQQDIGGSMPAERTAAVKVALAVVRSYKVYVSPWFAGSCRFEPTCSRYAYEAIERFGVMRGSWLALRRLVRCQPFSRKFGYDPVPEKTEPLDQQDCAATPNTGSSSATPREAHL